jgi:hypothetical protein
MDTRAPLLFYFIHLLIPFALIFLSCFSFTFILIFFFEYLTVLQRRGCVDAIVIDTVDVIIVDTAIFAVIACAWDLLVHVNFL